LRDLLNAAGEHTPDVLGVLAIGAFAGLRMAEIERLAWTNVDMDGGFVHVGAKKARAHGEGL